MAIHCSRTCLQYLIHLAHDNVDFRLPEIRALLSLRGKPFDQGENFKEKSPFWRLNGLSEEDVNSIMARTVCAKSAFELWGHGRTHIELRTSLLKYPTENMAMEYLSFEGRVNLRNPKHIFCLLEDYGTDPNDIPDEPLYIYFGRWIADGQRELIRSHSVKNRHFIGNTSMDAGLSFIMANHARVKAYDLVYDPFVGTGSLLVACSHFGAYVCGTDIDYNTIHGIGKASRKNQKWRGPDENIRANLRQYGSEKLYVDVLVSDASKPIWRDGVLFDAIITDPPYGIRESTRRTGSQKDSVNSVKPSEDYVGDSHVPVSMAYHLSDIFTDLLNFSAHHLVIGGRLVYWLPIYRPEYCEEMVPLNACLRLVSNCEQTLSSHTSRRLITMEKIKEPEETDALAHLSDPHFSPYQGHNAFREKYFSGISKRTLTGKEETNKMATNGGE
uniref:tRNA (guanine(10)-N(2))-methyltransferase TRMT11 n=1 Tax=Oncorhynchus tshawytscha TaxID=74940 RepID=A0A8C8J631_ONCTS